MPLIKQKPSFNHEVLKTMTKEEVIKQHPLADEDHVSKEWDKANGKAGTSAEIKDIKKLNKAPNEDK